MSLWRDEAETFDVPMTPLIDVVFLLLIFFLVATTFARREVDQEVNLPEAAGGEVADASAESLVINIRQGKVYVVDGRVVTADQLPGVVQTWREAHPDRPVAIRGDASVAYGAVARVMGVCRAAGVTAVDLPVEDPGPSAATP